MRHNSSLYSYLPFESVIRKNLQSKSAIRQRLEFGRLYNSADSAIRNSLELLHYHSEQSKQLNTNLPKKALGRCQNPTIVEFGLEIPVRFHRW